jgi:signal transduction histidine kinase
MAIENASLFALTDEKLREQTRTLEALVQSLGDGLILESSDGRILYCNRRLLELAGVAPEDIAVHTAGSLHAQLLAHAGGRDSNSPHTELSIHHNGRTLDLRLQSFDVTDDHGQLIGRGQLWLDVTGDKELDRMKSALIATVSHELRTPLAAIKGNITSLLADDVQWDAAAQREFLEVASAETDRLSALVTDLLDLSKIQAGTFVVHREPCALAPLVERAAARVRPPLGARLGLDLPPDLPLFHADPPRVEAILRNLLENAAKYSPPDAPIRLDAERLDGHLLVRVANDGPGIPPEHREKVFDRFYRVDTGLTRQASGAGLGLAICKGFVEAHGGKIWVEPTERGTVFAFTLPL